MDGKVVIGCELDTTDFSAEIDYIDYMLIKLCKIGLQKTPIFNIMCEGLLLVYIE